MNNKRQQYLNRFEPVLEHINEHLSDSLSLSELCQLANFSPFHFHRQFTHTFGISLNQYIRHLKLKSAAFQLAYSPEKTISDIAFSVGFENSESFSRAFKHFCEKPPSEFRNKPDWPNITDYFSLNKIPREISSMNNTRKITIENFPQTSVAVLEHHGSPSALHNSVGQFISWRKTSGQSPAQTRLTIGIPWKDPNTVDPEEFHFDICGSLAENEEVLPNEFGIIQKTIPGGRCAVLRHTGSTDMIDSSCYYLYDQWLPESGEELRDFPCYFHYIERMPAVAEHEQITDIYLPLK